MKSMPILPSQLQMIFRCCEHPEGVSSNTIHYNTVDFYSQGSDKSSGYGYHKLRFQKLLPINERQQFFLI